MSTTLRTLRRWLAPRWLTDGEGGLVGYALDLVGDAFIERARLGLMARFPQNDPTGATTAPEDALAALGRDRRVVRGINETAQSYAARQVRWLDDRKTAGNPFALMQKLAEYTGPLPSFRIVDASGNWYARAADGTQTMNLRLANWNWDGDASGVRWSRFWVVIYPNGLWTHNATRPVSRAAAALTTWDCTATPDQAATLRGIVADWKPAGTQCVNIIISFDGTLFDPAHAAGGGVNPDGLFWREYKSVAGCATPSRFTSSTSYWDGV